MTMDDHHLAARLAADSGRLLLEVRSQSGEPDDIRKAGDRLSHEHLCAAIARWRPADAILSEEGKDDPARLSADRVWIVDPLDGTREFGEPERTDWAVHVALWERGRLAAGAVALPAREQVLSTAEPPAPPAGHGPGSVRIAVSRTRPPAFLARLRDVMDVTLIPLGSAGAKTVAVIQGDVDAYLHDGGQYEWDSAAPVAVARAAGLHASRLDGSALAYNQARPWLPDMLICPAALARPLLEVIAAARDSAGTPCP